jgi:hypothetical protein
LANLLIQRSQLGLIRRRAVLPIASRKQRRRSIQQRLGSVAAARLGLGLWLTFYNVERPHQALDYRTPCEVFAERPASGYVDNTPATLRSAPLLTT